MTNFKQSMHDRINKRMEQLQKVADRLHRAIDSGQAGGEESRVWLDRFAVGKGYQIAGGDYIIGDSVNIDPMQKYLAPDILAFWDEVPFGEEIDFVVTNYFECFPSPLRTLTEWFSQLKPRGVVAMVLRDADCYYKEKAGPLANKNRVSCFNKHTIKFYFERAGFTIEIIEQVEREIRIVGRKI